MDSSTVTAEEVVVGAAIDVCDEGLSENDCATVSSDSGCCEPGVFRNPRPGNRDLMHMNAELHR